MNSGTPAFVTASTYVLLLHTVMLEDATGPCKLLDWFRKWCALQDLHCYLCCENGLKT